MQDGIRVNLLVGYETLEVVGESFYQDHLRALTGYRSPEEHVEEEIRAILVAEDHNPYDPDAVAVWIEGLLVGRLSRENARLYRPGLLAQQQEFGTPIALAGVITGGRKGSDRAGMLGVFLRHDPVDFGCRPHPRPLFAVVTSST